MSNLFSDEKVNTGRQVELDIAKASSITFMIFLHVVMVVKGFNNSLSPAYDFVSRHSQWNVMIRRGLILYITGIVVKVFEFILPGFVCGILLGRWNIFPMADGLLLFCVDILAFAGLAFVTMGVLKKFEVSNKWTVVIAVAMSLIGTFARGFDFGMPILNLFFADFIGSAGGFGGFPLLSSNINSIYVAQWFFIPLTIIFITYFFKNVVYTDLLTFIIAICMFALSTAVAQEYKKLRL